jgi:hypothetical protein
MSIEQEAQLLPPGFQLLLWQRFEKRLIERDLALQPTGLALSDCSVKSDREPCPRS